MSKQEDGRVAEAPMTEAQMVTMRTKDLVNSLGKLSFHVTPKDEEEENENKFADYLVSLLYGYVQDGELTDSEVLTVLSEVYTDESLTSLIKAGKVKDVEE